MKKIFNFLKEIVLWMVSIYAILVVLSILILLTENVGVEKPFNGVTHSSHKITTYEWGILWGRNEKSFDSNEKWIEAQKK